MTNIPGNESRPVGGGRIVPLARHPEHISTIAAWLFAEWGLPIHGESLERTKALIREAIASDGIPLTLIAVSGSGEPLGTASIVADDLGQGDPWTPWLASVFVPPAARGRGLGSQIVAAAEAEAVRLEFKQLYLFTSNRERFYARAGWKALDRRTHRGQAITIMTKRLIGSAQGGIADGPS